MYKQCEISRPVQDKPFRQVDIVWIPTKFAVQNSLIGIKRNGEWEEGWIVDQVYDTKITHEMMLEARDGHKYHRNNTDI